MISRISGVIMLVAAVGVVAWKAHRDGVLKPIVKGVVLGSSIGAFLALAMWLIGGGAA